MPNIGSMLRQEITRLSRRELRGEMQATKKASTQYRHHIAALRRQLSALERQVATLQRRVADGHRGAATASSEADGGPKLRFAASRLRAQRTRHGLTAGEYAKLLGVSEQTVYNWEHGTHRPGHDRLTVIAELRGLGKRAVQARLDEGAGKAASTKKSAAKRSSTKKSAAKTRTIRKSAGKKAVSKKRATKKSTAKKGAPTRKTTRKTAARRGNAAKSAGNASRGNRRSRAAVAEAAPSAS